MAIEFLCDCGKRLRTGDQYAGKRGKCPACGAVVSIPQPIIPEIVEEEFVAAALVDEGAAEGQRGGSAGSNRRTCRICDAERNDSEGEEYSPRDLTRMKPKVADEAAIALHSVASSVIMFNNPPGSADTPMWWICGECVSRCFSHGRTR